MQTVRPANRTVRPDVFTAAAAASSIGQAGLHAAAVAANDEQAVIDAYPKPDQALQDRWTHWRRRTCD